MFGLLGALFIALGLVLLSSNKKSEKERLKRSENINKNNHKKQQSKQKLKEEEELNEIKKSKSNAYSFIAAGVSCIIVEIVVNFI